MSKSGRAATAVIAEDEPPLRRQLCSLLGKVWPELDIVEAAEDGVQASDALDRLKPDVLFLDIEMPGLSGLDVARRASGRCHVVFVTAFDQYAVSAFEEGVVDYLLKPFDAVRLTVACERLKARLPSAPAELDDLLRALAERAARTQPYLRWINASVGNDVRVITVDEVCYFQSAAKYTRVVTAGSESLIRRPVRELLLELDPNVFWQIHRSTIVNVNAIERVRRDLGGHVQVHLKGRNEVLTVSHPYAHLFHQM